jgi:hypothetical protein
VKNWSPTFLWYDTDRTGNYASNKSLLPRERCYVETRGGYTDPQTHESNNSSTAACLRCRGKVFNEPLSSNERNRRRWWKGKSQIWDSKIWSRAPRDSDPRKTTMARTSSLYKKQTRPLVREGASEKQVRNCQRVINIWSWLTDCLTVSRNVSLTSDNERRDTLHRAVAQQR